MAEKAYKIYIEHDRLIEHGKRTGMTEKVYKIYRNYKTVLSYYMKCKKNT